MKTPRLLALVTAAALLVAAPLHHLHAAEVSVDVSSFAPRDPAAVISQIELNVLLKQYEKLLTQMEESRLEYELARLEPGGTDEQKKQSDERMESRLSVLGKGLENCRARIAEIVNVARKTAEEIQSEKEKAAEKAKQKAAQSRPAAQNPG